MREVIKHFYRETTLGYWLIAPLKMPYDLLRSMVNGVKKYYRYRLVPEKIFLAKTFEKKLGYPLNLENPKTLNEKIQWLKLNDRKPLHTLCADKFAVREHIKRHIGEQYLVPLLQHTDSPLDIVPSTLPGFPFVIKTNHSNGGVTIVRDKSQIAWERVQEQLQESMKNNFYYQTKEWQYKHIEPRILVEKLLLDHHSQIPFDYKIHCFNGKVVFIQVDIDRYIDHKRNLYDSDWNFIDCRWVYDNGAPLEAPKMLGEMQMLAETLAKDFRYVRVDFYCIDSQIFFGELTFHPQSGFGAFYPEKWDRIFGDKLIL